MQITHRYTFLFTTLLASSAILLSNCSSTGMERSEKAGISMNEVEKDIHEALVQVDITNNSLHELVKPGQSNVKKAFEKYSDAADDMEKRGKRMLEHSEKMRVQGNEYFEEWRTEGDAYRNPKIQSLSEQRHADLTVIFAEISSASVGVKGSFRTYLSDIHEIQTYLSNDLTPKGVESITPVAEQAITDGDQLKNAIDPVLQAIGSAKAELAHGGAQ